VIIVLVNDTFHVNNSGTTISAMRFARVLKEHGHTIRILTVGEPSESGLDETTGFYMHFVPELWIPIVTHFARKQSTCFGKGTRALVENAVRGADVVHIYQPWPMGVAAARAARRLGVPAIGAFHTQPQNLTYNAGMKRFPPAARFVHFMLQLFYGRFEHIHCPSSMIAAQLRGRGYKSWLHIISNGVDAAFRPDESVPKFDDGLFHIAMVGRLSPEKHQALLIKAAMESRYSDRIQLHFAGSGPDERKLKRMSSHLKNAPAFGMYSQDDLIRLLRRSHLYVHTSDIEIEGMGCSEALGCGLVPVISDSRLSATGQFALIPESLFKAGDHKSLASRVDYWIGNPQRRSEMSECYAQYMKRDYSLVSSVRQMERVYSALAKRGKCVYHRSKIHRFFSSLFTLVIATPILFLFTRVVLGVRMKGARNLRSLKGKGALTVCNHVHTLDSALVGLALFPRRAVFPTLSANLNSIFPGKLVHLFGGVPVPQNLTDVKIFFDEMEIKLRQRRVIHFFPEGHLVPYSDEIRDFKSGAFKLAAKAKVPIVPMTISYQKATGIYSLFRRKLVLRLNIGEPVYSISPDIREDEAARLAAVKKHMEETLMVTTKKKDARTA